MLQLLEETNSLVLPPTGSCIFSATKLFGAAIYRELYKTISRKSFLTFQPFNYIFTSFCPVFGFELKGKSVKYSNICYRLIPFALDQFNIYNLPFELLFKFSG